MATAPWAPDNGKEIEVLPNSKGLAIIVTNDYGDNPEKVTLHDTKEDGRVLKDTFEQLQFTTHWQSNATGIEITDLVNQISNHLDHPRYDTQGYRCIVFAFSGHGGKDDVLFGQDNVKVHLQEDIITQLAKKENIAEIPKLFFIDACRGKAKKGKTGTLESGESESDEDERDGIPKCENTVTTDADRRTLAQIITELEGNFLVGYATLSKRQAFITPRHDRHAGEQRGSVWMQELAKELRESNDSVQNIMDKVIRRIYRQYIRPKDSSKREQKLQQPETISRLVCGPLHLKDPIRNDQIEIHHQVVGRGRLSPGAIAQNERVGGFGARENEEVPRRPPDQQVQSNFFTKIFGLDDEEDNDNDEPLSPVAFFARGDIV